MFIFLLILFVCILLLPSCARADESPAAHQRRSLQSLHGAFGSAANSQYAYSIAHRLATDLHLHNNATYGGRQAGSDAEHAAADYLADKMRRIGLSDVEKAAAKCDKWQFNGASFTVNGTEYPVYTYATASTVPEGITAPIVYVGRGTMYDYEGVDVKGKIVLVDIDQRADWWITYPMLEAEHQGAAAILAANVGGFGQVADDALNSQDICGPTSIPTCSIGVRASREIRAQLPHGTVLGTLKVDNTVEIGKGTTYNVTGRIRGKSSEFQILLGGHYDTHFWGFQDDCCAVGLVLAAAKAMLDIGFEPENDIVFCLHGAEEWGSSYTQFDWTVGAWEMINTLHPEWVGKTLAFLNFELPAYEFATYTTTYSAPEMFSLLRDFTTRYPYAPKPQGCFPDGVLTEGYQTYTYSDDFSYYAAGVPSTVNGFLLQKDMEHVHPFYIDYYHTQYDTPDTYNDAVMAFNLRYYGALAIYIDQMPALQLDFTAQYTRLKDALDADIFAQSGADAALYRGVVESLLPPAQALKARIDTLNARYLAADEAGDIAEMTRLRQAGRPLIRKVLNAFRYCQKYLLGLMYERPIVPHQAPQETIALCQHIIDCLVRHDPATAVDQYVATVNNCLESYSIYFSPAVIDTLNDMNWGAGNQDNLYFGTNINFDKAEVEEASRSVYQRRAEIGGDFAKEIRVYRDAIDMEKKKLRADVHKETEAIGWLKDLLG